METKWTTVGGSFYFKMEVLHLACVLIGMTQERNTGDTGGASCPLEQRRGWRLVWRGVPTWERAGGWRMWGGCGVETDSLWLLPSQWRRLRMRQQPLKVWGEKRDKETFTWPSGRVDGAGEYPRQIALLPCPEWGGPSFYTSDFFGDAVNSHTEGIGGEGQGSPCGVQSVLKSTMVEPPAPPQGSVQASVCCSIGDC